MASLRAACRSALGEDFELTVVDVLKQPEAAQQSRVVATPTVIRRAPQPSRRVIGDLSSLGVAVAALGLVCPRNESIPAK